MKSKPKVSLISSFTVKGIQEAREHWPGITSKVELYAFMQSDLQSCFGLSRRVCAKGRLNALRVMADIGDDPLRCESIAKRLQSIKGDLQIVGLATFLPEIMAHRRNASAWQAAQGALRFLIELVRAFQKLGLGDSISTIEIVAGNRTDGAWLAEARGGTELYMVDRLSQDEAITRLLDRLAPIAKFAAEQPRVQFALELEPGPLFTIGNREALRQLCIGIENHETKALSEVIGLNLDIPHWDFLSGIDVKWLRRHENQIIVNRIAHAHVSDHSNGHFGDASINTFHSEERFGEWIELLAELNARPKRTDRPNYDGYISCEMEGCKDERFVRECVSYLNILINRYGASNNCRPYTGASGVGAEKRPAQQGEGRQ